MWARWLNNRNTSPAAHNCQVDHLVADDAITKDLNPQRIEEDDGVRRLKRAAMDRRVPEFSGSETGF